MGWAVQIPCVLMRTFKAARCTPACLCRGEVVLGAALKKFVKNVVDLDIELVEAQIKHARTNVRGNDSDKDVKQMVGPAC